MQKDGKNTRSFFNKGIVIFVCIMLLVVLLYTDLGSVGEEIAYTEFERMVEAGEVDKVNVTGDLVKILVKGSEIEAEDFPTSADYYFTAGYAVEQVSEVITTYNETTEEDIIANYGFEQPSLLETIMPYLSILLFVVFGIIIFRTIAKTNSKSMSFGKSRARLGVPSDITFKDVAGAEEEKVEMQELVEFLRAPERFRKMGARIPKGVILVGPPGTGKTLLAKAIAGESKVPFFSISGSDFVEMFVGVGASRVRDLFDQAKKAMPCIVFIDEIDAVGRKRGAGMGGGNDEREQTLNQLLVEMDGFKKNDGIIVIAATNRPDVLDPALLRPGRFDRQIHVNMPDVGGRAKILEVHAKNKPIAKDVDFKKIARLISGFSGADIENLLNEAAILTARDDRDLITTADITNGISKVIMGPQKRSSIITDLDKRITAYHEAGHAVIQKTVKDCDDVHEVSIIPRGGAAGYTMGASSEDTKHYSRNRLNALIQSLMGGRIAEELIIKDITTGAENDIKRATELATKMVTEFGMSEKLGFISYGSSDEVFIGRDYQKSKTYSEQTAFDIDSEIQKILNENYKKAKKVLENNLDKLHNIATLLIEKETLYKEEVDLVIAGESPEEIIKIIDKKLKADARKRAKLRKERKEREEKRREELREKTLNALKSQGFRVELVEKAKEAKKVEPKKAETKKGDDSNEK